MNADKKPNVRVVTASELSSGDRFVSMDDTWCMVIDMVAEADDRRAVNLDTGETWIESGESIVAFVPRR